MNKAIDAISHFVIDHLIWRTIRKVVEIPEDYCDDALNLSLRFEIRVWGILRSEQTR